MYCGACTHDLTLARCLMDLGHDVALIPLYTPLKGRADAGADPPTTRVFYGCINVYLQPFSTLFEHVLPVLPRWLDAKRLLRFVSRFAVETDPRDLGPMTVSVLQGEHGLQREQLDALLAFLRHDLKPDLVMLTNALVSGIAPALKEALDVPVVCALQGEDAFVRAFPQPYRSAAVRLMRRNAASIDLFTTPAGFYVDVMARFLRVPRARIRQVHTGLDPRQFRRPTPRVREPFTIGFLSRVASSKGIETLIEAFVRLRAEGRAVRLHVAGQIFERAHWRILCADVERGGLAPHLSYVGEPDDAGRTAFLHACSVFVLPCRYPMVRGLAVLEAMAAGLPVVASPLGIYPEIMEKTRGGVLVPSGDAPALAAALARLMDDPDEADAIGRRAADGVAAHFADNEMAALMARCCEELRGGCPTIVSRHSEIKNPE